MIDALTAIYVFSAPSGNVYVGKHAGASWDWPRKGFGALPDGYKGSGVYIRAAHKKHGKNMQWRIVAIVSDSRAWARERRAICWVRKLFGKRCMNIKQGGDGFTSDDMRANWLKPEYAKKNVEAVRAAHQREDVKHIWKQAAAKRWSDPDYVEKVKNSAKIAAMRPETQEKRKKSQIARWATPEAHEKASASLREQWSNPETKAIRSKINKESQNRPEVKARASETQKIVQNLPDVKERQKKGVVAAWSDPQKKAERLAKCRATREKNKVLRDE
jgi:hypothetical protein